MVISFVCWQEIRFQSEFQFLRFLELGWLCRSLIQVLNSVQDNSCLYKVYKSSYESGYVQCTLRPATLAACNTTTTCTLWLGCHGDP